MDPTVWGACTWKTLHILAIGYPKNPTYEDVHAYKNFYENFWRVIPCYKCSLNYRRHLKELPLDDFLATKEKLFEWTVKLHNLVNRELQKPEMSLQEATALYKKMVSSKKTQTTAQQPTNWLLIFTIIIIICVILYVFRKKISFIK
jgi:hypothetical protein